MRSVRRESWQRLLVAVFCWMTAAYAFMAASPFVYRQFLAPRVFGWLGTFSDWHAWLYWPWLLLAVPVRAWHQSRTRALASGFVIVGASVGLLLGVHPILPRLVDDSRSVVVGVLALVPVFWLALLDFVEWSTSDEVPCRLPATRNDGRVFVAAAATAVFVSVVHAAETPIAMGSAFEPDLLTKGLAAGFAWNLADHLVVFCGVFLVVALMARAIERLPLTIAYAAWTVLLALVLAAIVYRTIGGALGLNGWPSIIMAGASGGSVAATWSALRSRRWAATGEAVSSLDLLLGPAVETRARARVLVPFVILAAYAYAVGAASRIVDWDFLLLKCGVFALWFASFDRIYRLTPRARIGSAVIAVLGLTPLGIYAASGPLARAGNVTHALARYAVYNPSFRVVDGLLRDATVAGDDAFQRFLRDNTALGNDVDIAPLPVEFADSRAHAATTPDIFLFVVDSLRRDYLEPYNDAVTFTPSLQRFAAESFVFRNVFTAYGGTGLSVPAMWSGAFGIHKQYVQPFAPMNGLVKLLDANGYRRFLSMDSIVKQILLPSTAATELDRGRPNEAFRFCQTLEELQARLDESAGDSRPLFAYSLPQDLHVSNIISASVPAGETYPGFHPPYAARVHRIDACFGQFVDFLKRRGRYDRSLIIVTADHGEMLGEDGLWGHVYYLFPQVVEVPLIVHLPTASPMAAVDPGALALTIDITPTIYAALGYPPPVSGPMLGRSLVQRAEVDRAGEPREAALAASYSAVYAAARQNGRQLYIIDAVQHREYAYTREADKPWQAVPVSAGVRESGQRLIRAHVHALNHAYHVTTR